MKWPASNAFEWRRKFAWLPIRIGIQWVWWEAYEERLGGGGYGIEVRLPELV